MLLTIYLFVFVRALEGSPEVTLIGDPRFRPEVMQISGGSPSLVFLSLSAPMGFQRCSGAMISRSSSWEPDMTWPLAYVWVGASVAASEFHDFCRSCSVVDGHQWLTSRIHEMHVCSILYQQLVTETFATEISILSVNVSLECLLVFVT